MTIQWWQALRSGAGINAMLVVIAVAAGATALFAAQRYLHQQVRRVEADTEARYRPQAVVVASRDIHAGQLLSTEQLAVRRMPRDFLPATALPDDAASELIGRRLLVPLRRGDVVTRTALAPRASSLATELPPGHRAVTLAVDDIRSHAGLVRAGDEVDLYLLQDRGASGSRLSVLLERVPVIAIGERMQGAQDDAAGYGTITLRASSADAARILLAEQAGRLSVLLRARGDESPTVLVVRDTRALFERAPQASAIQRSPAIEVLLGGSGGPEPRRLWLASTGERT